MRVQEAGPGIGSASSPNNVARAQMAKKHLEERPDRYFQLHHYMLKTEAWRALSAPARAVYSRSALDTLARTTARLPSPCATPRANAILPRTPPADAFKELVDFGFIEETRHGGLSRKTRVASEWRMTAFRCDLTGASKTCLFMQRGERARASLSRWPRGPPAQPAVMKPVRLSQSTAPECLKRRHSLSQSTLSKSPECLKRRTVEPVFGGPPVSNDGTHIIYHPLLSRSETSTEHMGRWRVGTAAATSWTVTRLRAAQLVRAISMARGLRLTLIVNPLIWSDDPELPRQADRGLCTR